ncbi:mannitol dehydrogenase family protein [Paenarthrobacter nitroguajacolicus]|uniref:mannitol dehydrogenase family protein n=1 Tax=Paenarthrobacter nitroguajacolicus TaxID=211146 RepID=UPI00285B4D7F|nr:mannitol dehydrogenase family protein [Paenarthrobacter nitroguajacolicus]MDR6640690.1 fructuronate reductase [Paenarthrobacter nitroguajacolicus]
MTAGNLPRLNRGVSPADKAPVRIVHLGLGAFHRSHQAWYTQHAGDSGEWGIASFTGRRPDAAEVLAAQEGLFTLVERADSGDAFEVVGSIVEAADGANMDRLVELLAAPRTAVVTLTITEAAYGLGDDDVPLLLAGEKPTTPLGRLVLGLAARRDADAGPLAVVSCDNLSDNGNVARNGVLGIAGAFDAGLAAWIEENASFVSTSVDRITPRTTEADLDAVAASCGYRDEAPVVTEPFHNWVLSGDFPAGRPRWEDAGAVFVDDIEPYENRKLWLLNGAHSILAYAGQLRGHTTVAEALNDSVCRKAVEEFWDEASRHLPGDELGVPGYRAALLERFGNSRIAHHLAQIAMDATTKLRMRAIPVLRAERTAGREGAAAARMIAVWAAFVATSPGLQDPQSESVADANQLSGEARTSALLALLDPELAGDPAVVELVHRLSIAFAPASNAGVSETAA